MRNVVLYHLISLDGVVLADETDWFDDGRPEMFANLGRVIGTQDDILLRRQTYDDWAGYWPTSDLEPFASFINETSKHVFTSGRPDESWDNTTLVRTPPADYVAELKQEAGGDIGIHGSIKLSTALLRAGLVDVLELAVARAAVGDGRRVFADRDTRQQLELTDVARSPVGTFFLTYRRAGPST
jgi:dihydrofolate reductase